MLRSSISSCSSSNDKDKDNYLISQSNWSLHCPRGVIVVVVMGDSGGGCDVGGGGGSVDVVFIVVGIIIC